MCPSHSNHFDVVFFLFLWYVVVTQPVFSLLWGRDMVVWFCFSKEEIVLYVSGDLVCLGEEMSAESSYVSTLNRKLCLAPTCPYLPEKSL